MNNLFSQPLFEPSGAGAVSWLDSILNLLKGNAHFTVSPVIYFISYTLSLFGITMIIYALVRMIEIAKEEDHHLQHAIAEMKEKYSEQGASKKNTRWNHVQDLINSPNHSDWRLAIIEADSILEDLLQKRGLPNGSVGENLKNISPGDLGSMQAAWDAHNVRNRIAHSGSDYELTQMAARRTIQLYEVVFREFGFI